MATKPPIVLSHHLEHEMAVAASAPTAIRLVIQLTAELPTEGNPWTGLRTYAKALAKQLHASSIVFVAAPF